METILHQGEQGSALVSMSVVTLGEAYYSLMRRLGQAAAEKMVSAMRPVVSFVPVELELAIRAATLKECHKLPYADSFAAALAIRVNGTLVSADPDFAKLGTSVKLLKLPSHAKS